VFLPVDYQEYLRVSRKVKQILAAFTPLIEDVGIDEAFLDVSQSINLQKRSPERSSHASGKRQASPVQ